MHFNTKNYLKSTRNHTAKHALKAKVQRLEEKTKASPTSLLMLSAIIVV
jgi:hypothetical protein